MESINTNTFINENFDLSKKILFNDENLNIISNKLSYYFKIIEKTILAICNYKILDIYLANEVNLCINNLESIHLELLELSSFIDLCKNNINENNNIDIIINKLQIINNNLSCIIKSYGTHNVDDLINICFGSEFLSKNLNKINYDKYILIQNYLHPINYKCISWKDNKQTKKYDTGNKIMEDFFISENSNNLECFDISKFYKSFQAKIYGIKFVIHNEEKCQSLIIYCVIDDIMIPFLSKYKYIKYKLNEINSNKPNDEMFHNNIFQRYVDCLTLKDLLIYNDSNIYKTFSAYNSQLSTIKQKTIHQNIKDFLNKDLYSQRSILIQLLLKNDQTDFQYLAYLLYDLLSNDNNGNIDTQEQTLLYDSLPWNIKKYFKEAMKQTFEYTNNLDSFDESKIPIEQQICLMKAPHYVKEKAMIKLKEVKAKSEDSGTKARQYLDGLLKIPFGIFIQEESLTLCKQNKLLFDNLISIESLNNTIPDLNLQEKKYFTNIEIRNYINKIKNYLSKNNNIYYNFFVKHLNENKYERNDLCKLINYINNEKYKYNINYNKIPSSNKTKDNMINSLLTFIEKNKENIDFITKLSNEFNIKNINNIYKIQQEITPILKNNQNMIKYINGVNNTLDKCVHGHKNAKNQIQRIIGQWINGEISGYCFGFEGPPGIGKTTIAKKGISGCLLNQENKPRPFGFIAIGGSSNSSTLDGHNYTYVGSTWGRIVDILIQNKCMNPIIFIDELDKISKTEQGKEIIGILTHLVDTTQNNSFQDKYFSGIDLDLSKVLFIFSYNDADSIDRILLDRIHRIKFDKLTIEDKIVITREYILPELYSKMGLNNIIEISDESIEFIIENYTCECGVRKLKEFLFEIIGEINLEQLKNEEIVELPIHLTIDIIENKYLKEHHKQNIIKINENPIIGIINGLWANSLGNGGIIHIQTNFIPSNNLLDLKLTGQQGDVMQESMAVAKTVALNLLTSDERDKLYTNLEKSKHKGIHIHCPEGAMKKDGPSAGTAITLAIYSLLLNKKPNNKIALTGEINLQGNVTEIGGLDSKIIGGLKAGITHFIFPKSNLKDFDEFKNKYKTKKIENIKFTNVSHISEAMNLIFDY